MSSLLITEVRRPWVIFVLVVGAFLGVQSVVHHFRTYDLTSEAVKVAGEAAAAGEPVTILDQRTADSWGDSDRPSLAELKKRLGAGNARFAMVFSDLEAKSGEKMGPSNLGELDCYLFPIAPHRSSKISEISSLGRYCYDTDTSGTYAASEVSISNR